MQQLWLCRKSNNGQRWGSMVKMEGNIKPPGKWGHSTAPSWKGIRGLHTICHALWGRDLISVLLGCDRKMLRYMAEVTWRDRDSSLEMAGRCRERELGGVLKGRRVEW